MAVFANVFAAIWRWLSPPPPAEDENFQPSPAQDKNPRPSPGRPARKFDAIRTAVENRLNHLVSQEIPEHREIAKRDVLELHYIEIECAADGEATLKDFFKDFKPAARQDWIRDILGANAMVKLDCFAGIHGSADLPATGAIDKHEQMLNQGIPPAYAVHVWGQWVQAASAPPAGSQTLFGQPLLLRVLDAQGQGPDLRKDNYPLTIGRSGTNSLVVAGTFVSGDHCGLYSEQGRIWLEDRSKNGTWLDGKKLPPRQRVTVDAGRHRLKLGKESGEAKDCPEIELEFLETPFTPVANATPIHAASATPVIAPEGGLLAVLSITDATGNPSRDVLRLPYTLGRAADRDYTTPPAHAGVSSNHLTIEAITDSGARVSNAAHNKNGTALGEVLQAEEFVWPFDTEIVLAAKWRQAPPVRITLKRPG